MGNLFEFQGNDAEAEPYLRKALELRNKILGPGSADARNSFDSLSSVEGKLVTRNLSEGKTTEAARIQDDDRPDCWRTATASAIGA